MTAISVVVTVLFYSGLTLLVLMRLSPDSFNSVAVQNKAAQFSSLSNENDPVSISSRNDTTVECDSPVINIPFEFEDQYNPKIFTLIANGQPYTLALSSSKKEYIAVKAMEFCIEKQVSLQIKKDDIKERCFTPVHEFILGEIRKSADTPALYFNDLIDNIAEEEAFQGRRVAKAINQNQETIFKVKIELANGMTYVVAFNTNQSSARSVARNFCEVKATELKLTVEEVESSCIPQIEKYIVTEVLNFLQEEKMSQSSNAATQQNENEKVETEENMSNAVTEQNGNEKVETPTEVEVQQNDHQESTQSIKEDNEVPN